MAKFKVDGRLYEFLSAEQYAQLVNKADRDELINYVQTFASNANFPTTGERGIIYVDESTNEVFIWDGVKYDSINYDSISKDKVDAIPDNPKYTDTIYEHPATHPASMILEEENLRFVESNQIEAWDNKQDKINDNLLIGKYQISFNPTSDTLDIIYLGD